MEKKMIAIQNQADIRAETIGEESKSKVLRGYPILYDSPAKIGGWTEYVRKGALDGVDLSNLILLSQHEMSLPLALNGVNMRIEIDDKGLFFEATLPDTTEARDVYELVSEGIVSGMSYWFSASDVRENAKNQIVEILKFEWVREISVVTFPAYPETIVIAYEPKQEPKSINNNLLF